METWLIVLIVVVAVALIAAFVLWPQMRSRTDARKEEQARESLQEAQLRSSRAEAERAAAQEQVAAAQRERAEVEERAVLAEREGAERLANARAEEARAEELRERAERLSPGMSDGAGSASDEQAVGSDPDTRTSVEGSADPAYADRPVTDPDRSTTDPESTRRA